MVLQIICVVLGALKKFSSDILFFLFMFLLLNALVSCDQYAFLYAGSKGYYNYRHQADIFTIYHQLISRGFKTSQIGLYAFDDVVTMELNPYQGQLFHSIDHKVNIYPGASAINYRGFDVTAQSFYDAITKLPTTIEDYVFMYYDNHGGPGVIENPADYIPFIFANKISECFQTAYEEKLYKKILFIIEACYSGSIAQEIKTPDIAIITTANAEESSYAAVYDEELGTYLSNEFTNYFIDLIDEKPEITIGELFTTLKEETEQSHVCFYGDESIQSLTISTFIGIPQKVVMSSTKDKKYLQLAKPSDATKKSLDFFAHHPKASLRARSRIHQLKLKAMSEKLEACLDLLVNYIDSSNYDSIMNDKDSKITQNYYEVLNVFAQRFGKINSDDLGRLNVLKALAARYTKAEIVLGIFAVIF